MLINLGLRCEECAVVPRAPLSPATMIGTIGTESQQTTLSSQTIVETINSPGPSHKLEVELDMPATLPLLVQIGLRMSDKDLAQ